MERKWYFIYLVIDVSEEYYCGRGNFILNALLPFKQGFSVDKITADYILIIEMMNNCCQYDI